MTYKDIKHNEEVNELLKKGNQNLGLLGYTEHSQAHCVRVAETAAHILKKFGYPEHDIELARIAGYMHDIGNAILPMHQTGHRKHRMFIPDNTFTNPLNRHCNPIIGCLLTLYDFISTVLYFFIYTLRMTFIFLIATQLINLFQRNTGYVGRTEYRHLAVSVFSYNKCMHTTIVDAKLFSQHIF